MLGEERKYTSTRSTMCGAKGSNILVARATSSRSMRDHMLETLFASLRSTSSGIRGIKWRTIARVVVGENKNDARASRPAFKTLDVG